jgi:DNA helicase HerA-like ATPase
MPESLLIAKSNAELRLLPALANRHGLIAGATGTGKTVTLQRMAECFSAIGVPVFMADVKGDLSGISQAGTDKPKIAERINQLKLGESLVSFLDAKGTPTIVERALVLPPASRIGPASAEERAAVISASPIAGHYEKQVDRESAYERLIARQGGVVADASASSKEQGGSLLDKLGDIFGRSSAPAGGGRRREGLFEAAAKSAARAAGSEMGRQILRGVLGSILGGGRRH